MKYTANELRSRKTLAVGQADDLKVESQYTRVWLARTGVDDGEPYENKVTVERLTERGRWIVKETYPG